jgi:hypothetical protein
MALDSDTKRPLIMMSKDKPWEYAGYNDENSVELNSSDALLNINRRNG